MATAPGLNERLYCAGGGAGSRILLAASAALKDQQKQAGFLLDNPESLAVGNLRDRESWPDPLIDGRLLR